MELLNQAIKESHAIARGDDLPAQEIEAEGGTGVVSADVKPEVEAKGEAPASAEPEEEDDDAPPSGDERGMVPVSALHRINKKRADYKTELAVLKERLRAQEEAAKAPSGRPVAAKAAELPNVIEDPEGYAKAIEARTEARLWDSTLNASEREVRAKHDKAAVDEAVALFKEAAPGNAKLVASFRASVHPYEFVMQQAKSLKLQKVLASEGPDAYEARIRTEERAKIEAERSDTALTIDHTPAEEKAARRAPVSLASARSAASGKVAPTFAGPTPFGAMIGRNSAAATG
jgi:hypothetical protein